MTKKTPALNGKQLFENFEAYIQNAILKDKITTANTMTFKTKDMVGLLSYFKQMCQLLESVQDVNKPNNPNTDTINVVLLNKPDLSTAVLAGLTCTNNEKNIENYSNEEFLKKLIDAGHTSVLEHIVYTFSVNGFSRAVLQELSRHRHISQSVLSTRWALKKMDLDYHIPSKMEEEDKKEYKEKTDAMLNMAKEFSTKYGNDVAKYCIPESVYTKEVLTVNARELLHIFGLRTSKRALKEFQDFCRVVYIAIPTEHKFMYKKYFNE